MTKSTSSNRAAIVSLASIRASSALAEISRFIILLGELEPEGDLRARVVLALRPQVEQVGPERGQVGERPLEAEPGQLHRHVDDHQAGVARPAPRRPSRTEASHLGPHDGRAQRRGDDDPLAREVVGAEVALPARRPSGGCRGRGWSKPAHTS